MKNLEDYWESIHRHAKAEEEDERFSALMIAWACIDEALKVFLPEEDAKINTIRGIKKFKKIIQVFEDSGDSYNVLGKLPAVENLCEFYHFRNDAAHRLEVPSTEVTEEAVSAIHKVWRCMRRSYVSRSNAARIAKEILNTTGGQREEITNVFLFGSLTRHAKYDPEVDEYEPQDIDLLLFDSGNRPYLDLGYSNSSLIDLLSDDDNILSRSNAKAKKCGWLQVIYIDGSRFGYDKQYTLNLVKKQRDPFFFLNLSDGLMEFSLKDDKWVSQRPQVFQRLAYLRCQLENEYMVESQ
jgi:hypothetical protein